MRKSTLTVALSLLFSTGSIYAQGVNEYNRIGNILKKAVVKNLSMPAKQDLKTTGMNLSTTKESKTTTYSYLNNNWKELNKSKFEYDKNGFTTATETSTYGQKKRTVNEYDDKLYGFVTKTTVYTWDNSISEWGNPTTTYSAELTRNSKGQVTKETIYTYNNDSESLEKEIELDFKYGWNGKLNTISTFIEEEDNVTIPISVSNIKWYKYDEDRLFTLLTSNDESTLLTDQYNMIESADISMTINNISVKGKLKGTYSEKQSKVSFSIPFLTQTIMSLEVTKSITDEYGSYELTISATTMGEEATATKITATNNEYGDCIRLESSGSENINDNVNDESGIDINQIVTKDYEYYTVAENKVLKKSVTTNLYDKKRQEFIPTTKVTYDEYIDYVSGTTNIRGTYRLDDANNAVYSINGTFTGKSFDNIPKGFYIVKKQGKTVKIMKK